MLREIGLVERPRRGRGVKRVPLDAPQRVIQGALRTEVAHRAEGVSHEEVGVRMENEGVCPRRKAHRVKPAGNVELENRKHQKDDQNAVLEVVDFPFSWRELLPELP